MSENLLKMDSSECRGMKRKIILTAMFAMVLLGIAFPSNLLAATEKYVLDFCDTHVRAYRGEKSTLLLKKTMRAQYPWVDLRKVDLQKVVLVAKSKMGKGGAKLRIGDHWSEGHRVGGRPESFYDYEPYTFDRIRFRLPSENDHGPWQIDLRGNFIVRKVILYIEGSSASGNNTVFYIR